jgi:hypothetical protein
MIDPIVLQKFAARGPAELLQQLMALDPELAIPAALPLLAARLMGATAAPIEDEDDLENDLASA